MSDTGRILRAKQSEPPRAAYIHVPFCGHRCGYCNFALVAGRDDLRESYLAAVARELETNLVTPQQVDTLYFGGGTPTQLGVEGIKSLMEVVTDWHPLAEGHEWTVEANPADMTEAMACALADAGVNRLSLGGQSFRLEKLTLLERDHCADDIVRSVELANDAGVAVSLDMIFAAPGETLPQWRDDLEKAIALSPDHISVYGLTFEKGTTFWNRRQRGDLVEIDDDLQRAMYIYAIDRLGEAGYYQYEVSNFARVRSDGTESRSRHNETYWRGDEYYAAGPGAARYVDGIRETNHRSTTTYLKRMLAGQSPVAEREKLDRDSKAREQLVFGLRRLEGVQREEFHIATGFAMDELAGESIAKLVAGGFLADNDERIQLTREGLLVSDAIWPELL